MNLENAMIFFCGFPEKKNLTKSPKRPFKSHNFRQENIDGISRKIPSKHRTEFRYFGKQRVASLLKTHAPFSAKLQRKCFLCSMWGL